MVAQAAYQDLLSLLIDERASDLRGSPTRKERNGRGYWYDHYRVGIEVRDRYLGEDTPQLRARLQRAKELKEQAEPRRKERARLVRLLRSERVAGLDAATGSLLQSFAKIGLFRLGGTLVGTAAFRLYEGELGIRLTTDQAAMTLDIDIASFERLSFALEDTVETDLATVFEELDFTPVPTLDHGQAWRWRQASGGTLVEFLTPSFSQDEGLRPLPALGVTAQSLHHLNYLIAEPMNAAAVYRNGVLVQVPRPERYAIHKLIVADRRRDGRHGAKARKDLMQAELLIRVLAQDRPEDLLQAYTDALSRGPRWRERIKRSLNRSEVAARGLGRLQEVAD